MVKTTFYVTAMYRKSNSYMPYISSHEVPDKLICRTERMRSTFIYKYYYEKIKQNIRKEVPNL